MQYNNMDDIYRIICRQLLYAPKVGETREINGYSFTLTNLDNNVVNIRNISKSYICGELLWYVLGRNDVGFISKFAKLWERISDDGKTSNSAYGDIILKRHGFNQVDTIIRLLKKDPLSRRAVINFNVPNPNVINTKDEICTVALQFLIRNGKLNAYGLMRSNDVWFGLPYDVIFFTELQKYIARKLGVDCGTYTHTACMYMSGISLIWKRLYLRSLRLKSPWIFKNSGCADMDLKASLKHRMIRERSLSKRANA